MENTDKKIVLSKRMQAIFRLIPDTPALVDVGTDHGWIPIAAVLAGKAKRAIATDLREGPLARAREHVAEYGLEDVIETRLSDGLERVRSGEPDTIVIAGMGGALTIRILQSAGRRCLGARYLILQPQSEIDEVRAFLRKHQFRIEEESMAEDRGKFYPIMLVGVCPPDCDAGEETAYTILEDLYGPRLIAKRDPVLLKYLKRQEDLFGEILESLKNQPDSDKICKRRKEVEKKLEYNRRVQGEFAMADYEITLELPNGETEEVLFPKEAKILEIAEAYADRYDSDIILAMLNGKLRELNKEVNRSGNMSFVTVTDRDGKKTYRRSVMLLLQKAVQKMYGSESYLRVLYSLGEGYYCEVRLPEKKAAACGKDCESSFIPGTDKVKFTPQEIERMRTHMKTLCEQELPIAKHSVKTQEAETLFEEKGMHDKARLFHYRRSSRVNLYNLAGVEDYFYGYMAPSTGMLKYFDIVPYEEGFVILFPGKDGKTVEPLNTSNKLFHTLKQSRDWSRMLGVGTVGALNEALTEGKGQELMLLQEAMMEEQIGNIAAQIASDKNKKFVMIAGPSSSGKTSFANRLAMQLTAKGLKPHAVSLDNYYGDRESCPKNPDGTYDFECLEALDVEQFNIDMTSLLNGEEVEMPSFNFKTGKREYHGKTLQLGAEDILVIEGIHGLNDKLSYTLPAESKFKIYISALTQLNIDEHNPLPTTDGRLLRRIVRDARTRGTSAKDNIAMWPSVRRGEEQYIFPFQESADVMFNSALVYELAVLKVYAEPLLFQIPRDCPEYLEAKRLLKFLDYFLPMPSEGIHKNSLIREFVGGSCFNV